MRMFACFAVMVLFVVVSVQAMLDLPVEIYREVGGYLDTTSFLIMPQVCTETKKVWDGFSSKDLESHDITLRKAFEKKNAYILARFAKDKNYQELIENDRLARSIIIWAAQNGHRAIFDDLRYDKQISKAMSKKTSCEIKVWDLLCTCKDDCAKRATSNPDLDLEKEFVNEALLIAVKHNVPSIVHLFIHTRSYSSLIEKNAMSRALLMAVQNSYENIVKILLNNARVLRLVEKESVCAAITLACKNNHEPILKSLLYNKYIYNLLSARWLNKLSNSFCDDYIGHLIEECKLCKLQEVEDLY